MTRIGFAVRDRNNRIVYEAEAYGQRASITHDDSRSTVVDANRKPFESRLLNFGGNYISDLRPIECGLIAGLAHAHSEVRLLRTNWKMITEKPNDMHSSQSLAEVHRGNIMQ